MPKTTTAGYEWTFDPDRSDGGIIVDSVGADMPEYHPGSSYSMGFAFWENERDSENIRAQTGATLGTATGFTLGGRNGATVGSIPGPGEQIDRYDAVREYTRWAGRYSMNTAIDGTPRFSEHVPDDATVDSIVVKLEPGPNVRATPPLWVILDGVDDQTRFPADAARLEIDFTVLARGDEYGTRATLKADMGNDLV